MENSTIFEKISHYLSKFVGYICILMGIVMTITTLVGILFRYVMTNPLPWTEELARYTMIWMGLLAISIGIKNNSHLGVNLFINFFPRSIRKIILYITRILIFYFLYMLLTYGYSMALKGMNQIAPALRIQMFYVLVSVPIAALLSIIQLILITIIDIKNMMVNGKEK